MWNRKEEERLGKNLLAPEKDRFGHIASLTGLLWFECEMSPYALGLITWSPAASAV